MTLMTFVLSFWWKVSKPKGRRWEPCRHMLSHGNPLAFWTYSCFGLARKESHSGNGCCSLLNLWTRIIVIGINLDAFGVKQCWTLVYSETRRDKSNIRKALAQLLGENTVFLNSLLSTAHTGHDLSCSVQGQSSPSDSDDGCGGQVLDECAPQRHRAQEAPHAPTGKRTWRPLPGVRRDCAEGIGGCQGCRRACVFPCACVPDCAVQCVAPGSLGSKPPASRSRSSAMPVEHLGCILSGVCLIEK